MEFLKAYIGALGGTATALLLIGFFGKSIIEQWLKQNYKEWELEAEKPYKEDFSRFENKLDKIAAKDKVKLDYAHPKRAEGVTDVYAKCVEFRRRFNQLVVSFILKAHRPIEELNHRVFDQGTELLGDVVELEHFLETQTPLLGDVFCGAAQHYLRRLSRAIAIDVETITPNTDKALDVFTSNDVVEAAQRELVELQTVVEKKTNEILGTPKHEKSVPG